MKTPRVPFATAREGHGAENQDRAWAFEVAGGLIVALADGAGGFGDGGRAADRVRLAVADWGEEGYRLDDESLWTETLGRLDRALVGDSGPGETTAVVLAAIPGRIVGASVGDSEAWFLSKDGAVDLTVDQARKPLIGSGLARPVAFRHDHDGGILLVGTDGLFKYAPAPELREIARRGSPDEACRALIDRVRLRNGTLQDDVALVIARLPGPRGMA